MKKDEKKKIDKLNDHQLQIINLLIYQPEYTHTTLDNASKAFFVDLI